MGWLIPVLLGVGTRVQAGSLNPHSPISRAQRLGREHLPQLAWRLPPEIQLPVTTSANSPRALCPFGGLCGEGEHPGQVALPYTPHPGS